MLVSGHAESLSCSNYRLELRRAPVAGLLSAWFPPLGRASWRDISRGNFEASNNSYDRLDPAGVKWPGSRLPTSGGFPLESVFNMNERITMAEVAKRAGVHVTTVSMSLRDHPTIPVTTRERIQLLAKQMGYQRDPALSALVAYRNHKRSRISQPILAYVTNWDTRWGWKDHAAHKAFFTGAAAKAPPLGYKLEHFWLGEPGLTHRRMSDILYSRGISGLIIASHRQELKAPLDFDWSRFSAVKIDFAPREQPLHLVTNDQCSIIGLAMQRAMAAGYRRIGLVMPYWWDEFVDLAWSAGFLAHQQRLAPKERIPILYFSTLQRPDRLLTAGPEYLVPTDAIKKWLRAHRPEVLLSYGPFVRTRLAELGIAVPADLAFVEIFLEKPNGRIAGVHQNCLRVGELAVEIVAAQLQQHMYGIPPIPTATIVEGTWFDGESLPPHRRRIAADRKKSPTGAAPDGPASRFYSRTPVRALAPK